MAQYYNLKDYFYGEYGTELKSAISSQILAGGSHKNISDITIISLKCDDDIASNVTITLGIAANVVDDIESSMSDKQFFIVTMKGNLDIQFQDIRIIEIRSAEHDELPEDNILSHFILPDIPLEQVERIGNELYVYYKKHAKFSEPGLSLEKIIDNMCAPIFFSDLTGDCLGRVNFVNSDEKIYHYDTKEKIMKYDNHSAEPGTILINKKRYYDELNGEVLITVAHELIHWQLHQKFFKLLVILGTTTDAMNCSATISIPDDNMTDVQKALCIAEWQANTLAMRLAIPQSTAESTIKKIASDPSTYRDNVGDHMQTCVIEFAKIYNVSPLVAKERLRQLGYDYVDGTCFEYEENGKKVQAAPFYFQPGTLEDGETFIIYRDKFNQLLRENKEFAEIINSGRYIYLGYVVCQVDQKYIDVIINEKSLSFQLTTYAREHADECCIKFAVKSVFNKGEKYVNYGQTYLSNNKNELLQEYEVCIPDDLKEAINSFAKEDSRLNKTLSYCDVLAYYLFEDNRETPVQVKDENGDFSYTANRIIAAFAEKAGLSSTIIKRYLKNGSPPKLENTMRICFGLGLDETQSRDMIKTTGHYIDAPTAENIVCRMLFRLPEKKAKLILDEWKPCVEYIKEMNAYNNPSL